MLRPRAAVAGLKVPAFVIEFDVPHALDRLVAQTVQDFDVLADRPRALQQAIESTGSKF